MPVLQVVLPFSSDISHLYYTCCMPWPFHPFSFIIWIMFCKGDKLQHPSLSTVIGVLLLPKLMSVRTNYSTLSTADWHITMQSIHHKLRLKEGKGGTIQTKLHNTFTCHTFSGPILCSVCSTSEECTVDIEVMWWKKMYWLYMTVWRNLANQYCGRGEEGQFICTVSSQLIPV